jgi:hypothetical protein
LLINRRSLGQSSRIPLPRHPILSKITRKMVERPKHREGAATLGRGAPLGGVLSQPSARAMTRRVLAVVPSAFV